MYILCICGGEDFFYHSVHKESLALFSILRLLKTHLFGVFRRRKTPKSTRDSIEFCSCLLLLVMVGTCYSIGLLGRSVVGETNTDRSYYGGGPTYK